MAKYSVIRQAMSKKRECRGRRALCRGDALPGADEARGCPRILSSLLAAPGGTLIK
ncbi:hypothetical protein ccbrp13_23760 [Ktedonobacteria bacterium brp13]|nr:hypothetical protein ccbrp13_23760 [Ktedonobacteria bacterium brp13]